MAPKRNTAVVAKQAGECCNLLAATLISGNLKAARDHLNSALNLLTSLKVDLEMLEAEKK